MCWPTITTRPWRCRWPNCEAARDLDSHGRLIRDLEARGKLDRAVEFLPSDAQLKALAKDGKVPDAGPNSACCWPMPSWTWTRRCWPAPCPTIPFFAALLAGYFPPAAVSQFPQEPERHRLKREIISTVLTNSIVNLAGPVFVLRTREVTGLPPPMWRAALCSAMAPSAFRR